MALTSFEQRSAEAASVDVSIVIPVFNEADNVLPLYEAIYGVMKNYGRSWEVIFIDDGSTDLTFQALKHLHSHRECVQVIRLRRNYGQTAALAAGFDKAHGMAIVTMDGDLQNDPADIPSLVAKLEEGYDLVSGWRIRRKDPFLTRRLPSKIANRIISLITGVRLHDYGCTLKALRREFAKELRLYGEMHRFIPALSASLGASIAEIEVNHHPRVKGRSKYGLTRTVRVILDLLTVKFLFGYATRPGHVFGLCGITSFATGLGITTYLGFQRVFLQMGLADRPLLMLGVLLTITGIQFISIGLLGEMLSRTYHESQQKPTYLVRDILTENRENVLPEGSHRLAFAAKKA